MSAARLPPDIVAAVPVHTLRALLGPRPVTVAPYAAPDDIPPEHVITDRVVLPTAAHEAVVELVNNPPPPTPALVACMAPEGREPVTLAEAIAVTNLLRDALGDRCRHTAPAPFAQAGARCEREPHPTGNHRVAPRDGLPGAVWSDARSRADGGS